MRREKSLKDKIYSWFRNRGNVPATVKQVQEAFPDVNPKSISATLSGRDKRGRYNFNACPSDYSNPIRYYSFLPIEEATGKASCGGDCSHCEAETCASKDEAKSPKVETKKASIKDRIVNWFRDNENKPALLKEVQAAFPDVNPKSVSGVLSRRDSNGDFDFVRFKEFKNGKWRIMYNLWVEDYAPFSWGKPLAEAETCSREEEQEAGSRSLQEDMLAAKFFSSSEAEIPQRRHLSEVHRQVPGPDR